MTKEFKVGNKYACYDVDNTFSARIHFHERNYLKQICIFSYLSLTKKKYLNGRYNTKQEIF